MSGKGSGRRKEDTQKVKDGLDRVKWGARDKSKDTFKVKVNGKYREG